MNDNGRKTKESRNLIRGAPSRGASPDDLICESTAFGSEGRLRRARVRLSLKYLRKRGKKKGERQRDGLEGRDGEGRCEGGEGRAGRK